MLVLEEAGLKRSAQTSSSAMLAREESVDTTAQPSSHRSNHRHENRGNSSKNQKSGGGNGRRNTGGGSGGGGKSGGSNRNGGPQHPSGNGGQQSHASSSSSWSSGYPWMPGPWMQWAIPPCPFPTSQWARPNLNFQRPHSQPGILGSRPQQAYSASTPTDIAAAMHTLGITPPDANWYMDTGATSHMTSGPGNLTTYFNLSTNRGITVGNGQSIPIHGYGHTTLASPHPPLSLNNVLHAPHLIKNLVSVRKFTTDNSVSIEFDPFGFSVKDFQTGMRLMRCESRGALYPITKPSVSSQSTFAALAPSLWHNRLGHPGANILSSPRRNKFIECNSTGNPMCHSCPLGKHIKLPFVTSSSSTIMPFDIVHTDLWTSPVLSSTGHRYYIVLLDDFSKFLWTFPLSKKSDAYSTILNFKTFIRTQFERDIKNIQCDNGREFDNGPFWEFCTKHGISFRLSCPHTSPQNGKAERQISTINNVMRTLLAHASLPPSFWHHALQMATYLLNLLPHKNLKYQSPLTILYHKDPSYSHLRVFGCLCFPLFPSTTIHKLQPRSTPCVFLGYPANHRGYKCYDISSCKIIISRHLIFDETQFPFDKLHTPQNNSYDFLDDKIAPYITQTMLPNLPAPSPNSSTSTHAIPGPSTPSGPSTPAAHVPFIQPTLPSQADDGQQSPQLDRGTHPSSTAHSRSSIPAGPLLPDSPTSSSGPNSSPSSTSSPFPQPPLVSHPPTPIPSPPISRRPVTRSMNGIFKPKIQHNLHTSVTKSPLPRNPLSALRDPNWKMAMADEFDALIKNKTWDMVPRPPNVNVIRSMWIFAHKENSDGSFDF